MGGLERDDLTRLERAVDAMRDAQSGTRADIASLRSRVEGMTQGLDRRLTALEKTVFGNGKPGLKTSVTKLTVYAAAGGGALLVVCFEVLRPLLRGFIAGLLS